MARKPRIHFSGAVYHVILTGFDQQSVFQSTADRRYWESLVADGVNRFGHTIHGFCWAKNHVQMAIQVHDVPLSKIMQNLTFRYTRYYNSTHTRKGPLFHGRYKAILIDADQHLSDLVRFIHNNPFRNSPARSAGARKWTSHAGYLDAAAKPDWLTTRTVLNGFGKSENVARKNFARFVDSARTEGDRPDLMVGSDGGRILGDEKFTRKVLKPVVQKKPPVTLNELVKRVCREEGVKETDLVTASRARNESHIRQTITYLAMELNVASLTDMARRFNRDLTTMSRNQRYYREKLSDNELLQKHLRKLKRRLLTG